MQIAETKKDFHIFEVMKIEDVDSILNKTPPKGVPKARVTPAATAAVSILFLQEIDLFKEEKIFNFNNLLQKTDEK